MNQRPDLVADHPTGGRSLGSYSETGHKGWFFYFLFYVQQYYGGLDMEEVDAAHHSLMHPIYKLG